MVKKNLLLVLISVVLFNNPVAAMEIEKLQSIHDLPNNFFETSEAETKGCKCKKFKCINVCGTAYANSFITPAGALFNGFRNYALLTNQAPITTTTFIGWDATPVGNLSNGITVNNLTGTITLPPSGIFLVQYSVRFTLDTSVAEDSAATIQLFQTGAVMDQIAIQNNTTIITTAESTNIFQTQITGYGLVTVASPTNRGISLGAIFDNGYTIPGITLPSTDANAQMIILQLN